MFVTGMNVTSPFGHNPLPSGGYAPDQYQQQARAQMGLSTFENQQAKAPDSMFSRTLAAQELPALLQQNRFSTVFPWLQGQLGGIRAQTGGGNVGPATPINTNPIYNPEQIQQQVNASRAATDQSTASQVRAMQQQMGGRGFASQSPLVAALQGQYQNQGLASNVGNETNIRMNAAQQNAGQVLSAQQAAAQQNVGLQQAAAERQRNILGLYGSLFGAMSGLV